MELALALFNVGAGLGLLAVGAALLYLAWRLTPLIRETRALEGDLRRLSRTTEREIRALIDRAAEATRAVEIVADDAAVKVARLDELVRALEAGGAAQGAASRASSGSVESPETWEERSDS